MWFALLTSSLFDSRNLFTDNEHELLVEYLATYNPQSGRDEKTTYIRLAEMYVPKDIFFQPDVHFSPERWEMELE